MFHRALFRLKNARKVLHPHTTKLAFGGAFIFSLGVFKVALAEEIDIGQDYREFVREKQEAADFARVKSWRDPNAFRSTRAVRILSGDGDIVCTQAQFEEILQKDRDFRVVSVIGPLKNGKSHFLNSLFFEGKEIFATSNEDESTTKGCWIAQSGDLLLVDCEGLMDPAQNLQETENRKQTLQLILGISDLVVYICASPTLDQTHANLIEEVSVKYMKTIAEDLKAINIISNSDMQNAGPSFLIYHRRPNDYVKPHSPQRIKAIFRGSNVPTYNNGGTFRNFLYQETLATVDFSKEKDLFALPLPRVMAHELSSECLRRAQTSGELWSTLSTLASVYSGNAPIIDMKSIYRNSYACTATCKVVDCQEKCTKHFRHTVCPVCGYACNKMEHNVDKRFAHQASHLCKKDEVNSNYREMCNLCREEGRPGVPIHQEKWDVSTQEAVLSLGISPVARYLWRGKVYKCPYKHDRIGTTHSWFGLVTNQLPVYEEIDHVWTKNE